jgi:biotin transport system substrate-specific component
MTTFAASSAPTLADALLHKNGKAVTSLLTETLLVTAFAGFVALTAQIRIPLPFTPVPITGQTLGVLLTGSVLGSKRGVLSMLLYLVWGAIGLHVYAGGSGGSVHLIGATGGYLLSYPVTAWLVGRLAERGWDRTPKLAICSMLIGSLVIYLMGVVWLAFFVGGIGTAVVKGMLPFLPGDLIKVLLAAMLLPGGWMLVRRIRGEDTPANLSTDN